MIIGSDDRAPALFAALGVGVGAIMRNQVGAIVGSLVYLFVLENLLADHPGRRRRHRQVRLRRRSATACRRDPTPSDLLGQVPAGLLLAGYARSRDHRHPPDATAGRHRLMHLRPATPADAQAAADLVIADDIAEIGERRLHPGDLSDEWRELDIARDTLIAEFRPEALERT